MYFADGKALEAVRSLGIDVEDGAAFEQYMGEELDWSQYKDVMGHDAHEGARTKGGQVAFVLVLERALGCVLEGNSEALIKAAK